MQKVPNAEKQRVRMVYRASVRADENGRLFSTVNKDSSAYYNHILAQEDFKRVIGSELLPGDSLAYAIDSTVAGLYFDDFLLVSYKYKRMPVEFKQLYPKSGDAIMSEITLVNPNAIQVYANGSYFNPEDLLSSGYWGWWEKIGTMLPYDYQPPKK